MALPRALFSLSRARAHTSNAGDVKRRAFLWLSNVQSYKHAHGTSGLTVADGPELMLRPLRWPGVLDSSSSRCLSSAARNSTAVGSADAGLFSFAESKSERTCRNS